MLISARVWGALAALALFLALVAALMVQGRQLRAARAETVEAQREAADWRTAAGGWRASFDAAETLRAGEAATANAAAASLVEQCAARVAEARQSARVIERIVTKEPTYEPNRCPVRERIDPGLLRGALVPDAGTD